MYSNMNDDFNIEDLVGVHSLKPVRRINQFPTVVDDFFTNKFVPTINRLCI